MLDDEPRPRTYPSDTATPGGAIAIIGTACHFPGGCTDPATLWKLLCAGGTGIGPAPTRPWLGHPPASLGGFLPEPFPAGFDARFFDMPAAEARLLDPQQRLLLEVGWRALESAGIAVDPLAGRPIGVFVAISTTDFQRARLWQPGLAGADPFTATGVSFAAAAGRLSYCFGFTGPCLPVDTACSSSLVALHLACQALRNGECEAALVAGVNALLAPNLFACLDTMSLLSPDGQCRAFDADGNGYVRAEGCGAVVLKPLARAQQDGDAVLAVCRGSSVNQDGRTSGLTAPSGTAQQRVIANALASAGLAAADIDYVEAHGTGTLLGDAIELNALAASYAHGRDSQVPLLVGSVKANIGHLEAGAGMAGLIKAVLCLQHGAIPPQPALRNPTPHLAWDEVALRVPTALTPWPDTGRKWRAAVSSFGFSGTNAHVILEQAPRFTPRRAARQGAVVLPLSARTPAALDQLAAETAAWLEAEPLDLVDAAYTLGAGRTVFAYRRAVVGVDRRELAGLLRGASPVATADPVRARLQELAALFVARGDVDWARLYRPAGGRIVAMPGHPFQRQHYWPEAGQATAHAETQGPAEWCRLIDSHARAVLSERPMAPLNPDAPLVDQGFTSLLALELRRVLEAATGRTLPPSLLYNYPSIRRMAALFAGTDAPPQAGPAPPPPPPVDNDFAFLEGLSAEELTALIEREVDPL